MHHPITGHGAVGGPIRSGRGNVGPGGEAATIRLWGAHLLAGALTVFAASMGSTASAVAASSAAPAPVAISCHAAPGIDRSIAAQEDRDVLPATDPLHGGAYRSAVRGLVYEQGAWRQHFEVYYQEGSGDLAHTIAVLLCRLYCYGEAHLAPYHAFLDPTRPDAGDDGSGTAVPLNRFYISNSGNAGGAEDEGALYLLEAVHRRHPVELAREVAHEYSHLTVPGIRGFDGSRASEDWANGYLGEVLYTRWLGEDSNQTELPGGAVLQWSEARCLALEGAFLKVGPGIFSRPANHFWEFEGALLYLGDLYGFPLLARVLAFSQNTTGADTAQKIADALAGYPAAPVKVYGQLAALMLEGGRWVPYSAGSPCTLLPGSAVRQYVYLRRGDYHLKIEAAQSAWRLRGAVLGRGASTVLLGGFSDSAAETTFPSTAAGWYLLQWRNVGPAAVTIESWNWDPVSNAVEAPAAGKRAP
ncbi:MAG: hypothetical protein LC772_05090 [Chloroflexi bacterium]|nr:hypothetical protein [Chloroflexota bacterium]